jgi:hypothetical protein
MFIPCEKAYAEDRLKNGFTRVMSFVDLSILAKYFKYLGKNKTQIHEDLVSFCKKFYGDYNNVLFAPRLQKAIDKNDESELRIFKSIGITKNEIDIIHTISDFRYQKILFIFLIIGKIFHEDGEINYYCNNSFTEVIKEAKVNINKKERERILHELNLTGLVSNTLNGSVKINFVDESQNDFYIIVNDKNNLISFFPFECFNCKKELNKISRKHNLCEECYKEKRRMVIRDSTRKYRENNM